FQVPDSWKRVQIPFLHDMKQEINSPEAKNIHIDFLRKDLLPLDREVLIRVFYPLPTLNQFSPESHPLMPGEGVIKKEGVFAITQPLFVDEVSRLFLDVVRDYIEVVIIAAQKEPHEPLQVSVNFIDPRSLEEVYLQSLLSTNKELS